jgi:hypothetical protein
VPNRQKYSSKPNEHECTAKPNVHDCTSEPNKPAARPQRDIISEKQQELKRRLTERYGSNRDERLSRYSTPQQAHSTYEDNVGSIMSRANANVAAYADNRIEEEGKAASIPVTKGHVDDCINDPDDCSLMDTVNDLIVMGYQSDLTFERDFIAEGMEMLGNISA